MTLLKTSKLESSDIKNTLKKGKKIIAKYFRIYAFQQKNNLAARIAVIIGKKVSKRAVDRNYSKRLIKNCFFVNQKSLAAYDYVVIFSKKIVRENSKCIINDLEKSFYLA